jgi:pentatricopeptide repeat protein
MMRPAMFTAAPSAPAPLRPAVTFNALLECCTKHNDAERAAEIMGRMATAGVQPDDYTLEAVRPRRSMRSLLKRNFDVSF